MTRRFTSLPTRERLQELLSYDPKTGHFTWRQTRGPVAANTPAGWLHKAGYIYIGIDDKQCKAHRLAWLMFYGVEPTGLIDHIDRNTQNNAIDNLREVSEHQSNQNKKLYRNNRAGVKGVGWLPKQGKWRVRIQAGGRVHSLGLFRTFEEAVLARQAGEKSLHIDQRKGVDAAHLTM